MRRDRQVALIDRLLAVCERGELEPSCQEARVAVERYISPERHQAEGRVLFRRQPIIVGRAGELAEPGAFFTHDAAGVPLLLTRDQDGTVHAMLNVCRHRGTRLVAAQSGTAKSFVCRYHAWTYDLCGRLGHVPLARCFPSLDRGDAGLVELPCETRHGFVWVLPTPGAPLDLAGWLGDFDDDLAAFELAQHVVFARSTGTRQANWKLVMDAFLEGYHVRSLHQRTLARFFREDVVMDTCGPHVRSLGARRNLPETAHRPRDCWDVRECTTVFYALFPNTVLVFHPETISHIALFPRGVGEVDYVHTMLAPHEPLHEEQRAGWQRTWELIDGQVFSGEDLMIAESIQSVLHAGADTAFRIGRLEHPICLFHEAIDRALAAHQE